MCALRRRRMEEGQRRDGRMEEVRKTKDRGRPQTKDGGPRMEDKAWRKTEDGGPRAEDG